ncbi:hypothetical protein GGR60_003603 [Xanthomonas arboricola]|nr:hypothetical protein [Xanthomonas euroxanthea]
MRIFTDLLFQHGHIADVDLAQQLAEPDAAGDPAAPQAPEVPPATDAEHIDTAQSARREQRMARRTRRLLRAITALSPFRLNDKARLWRRRALGVTTVHAPTGGAPDQAFSVANTSLKVLLGRIASLTLARSGW